MLKVNFRRFWPAKQDGACPNGHLILAERFRRPCRECGELRRNFNRFTFENFGVEDVAS